MEKILVVAAVCGLLTFLATGCGKSEEEYNKVVAERDTLKTEKTALAEKVTELETKCGDLETQVADLKPKAEEAEGLKSQVDELQAKVGELEGAADKVKVQEGTIAELQAALADVQKKHDEALRNVDILTQRANEALEQLKPLKEENEKLTATIRELEAKIEAMKATEPLRAPEE